MTKILHSTFRILKNTALGNITNKLCVLQTQNLQAEEFGSEWLCDIVIKPVTVTLQGSGSSADNSDTCDEEELSGDHLGLQLHRH
jgi:hypothetical protein